MYLFKINNLYIVALINFSFASGWSFSSKLIKQENSGINEAKEDFELCETVRVMPRIAMAVVGGVSLKSENSAPYVVAIGERISNGSISWFCGGSLLSATDILTAAHCLVSRQVTTVRLGSFSTKKKSTEDDYEILKTIIHPQYKITESYHDIAIIKVKNKIDFDDNIKPICLPQDDKDNFEKKRARVIGWGAKEFGGEGSQKLQQVEVEVFGNKNCEKAYHNSTIAPKNFPKGIIKEQLCAGSSKGGKDACQGDSGGPLVLTDENGIVRQIGIVSTGAGCGFKMYPGVYTRVSCYTDWIQQQIKKPKSTQSQNTRERNSDNLDDGTESSIIKTAKRKSPSHQSSENSKNENGNKLYYN